MTRIGIVGCQGRMGQMLVREVLATDGVSLAGGTERAGSDAIGRDLGELLGIGANGLTVGDDAGTLFAGYQGTMRTGHSSHGLNVGVRLEF